MALQIQTLVGPGTVNSADGVASQPRAGRQNDTIVSELHGRFYEPTYRGNTFRGGISTLTSISNATFTVATTGATATPIVGLWNPVNSGVNAAVSQASVSAILTALQATGCGGFVWMSCLGNSAISTGTKPVNMATLSSVGAKCLDMSGVALTGMTGTLAPKFGSAINAGAAYNTSLLSTAVGFMTTSGAGSENFDGGIFVPPGGVLGLFASTTPVAHSAVSGIFWEEVAL